jgi:hypothetical protein
MKKPLESVFLFSLTIFIMMPIAQASLVPVYGTINNNVSSFAASPAPSSCIVAPNNLLSWWTGDGNANDVWGPATGIINGQVSFVGGKVDRAFNFTGNGFISTPMTSFDRDGDGSISVDAWIKIPSTPNSFQHVLGVSNLLTLDVDSFGQIWGTPTVNTTNGPLILSTPAVFPVGNSYHHVAFVYDASIGRGYLYIDGLLAGQSAPVPPGTKIVQHGQGGFTIGNLFEGGQSLIGSVDEVEAFDAALSQSQINSIVNAGSSGKCKPIPNQPPNCDGAYTNVSVLWPPNHAMKNITINGIVDPDANDNVYVNVTSIRQDEPTSATPGDPSPDGNGLGTSTAQVRSERLGLGDGRVYHIGFTALDGQGGFCMGDAIVSVPPNQAHDAIDSGPVVDSTQP